MELAPNPFKRALRERRPQVGLWVSLCSGYAAEVVAPAGFDWALLDMEHSPSDYFSVLGQLQAFAASGTIAIVRAEWNDTVTIKRLLDLGVPGLLLPMVQTVEEARRAVAATRYPPRGVRGVAGSTRANRFGRVKDYVTRVEEETALLLQIESRAAVGLAAEIAAIDGVDGIFFGPGDIAADMGLVGQPMHADVWSLIRPVAESLISEGVAVGTLVQDPAFAAGLLNDGFTFVACGADTVLLSRASDALLAQVRGALT